MLSQLSYIPILASGNSKNQIHASAVLWKLVAVVLSHFEIYKTPKLRFRLTVAISPRQLLECFLLDAPVAILVDTYLSLLPRHQPMKKWWRIRNSNPSVVLIASEVTTPSSPIPHKVEQRAALEDSNTPTTPCGDSLCPTTLISYWSESLFVILCQFPDIAFACLSLSTQNSTYICCNSCYTRFTSLFNQIASSGSTAFKGGNDLI